MSSFKYPMDHNWLHLALLTFSCMEEASLPVGWGCSGTTGQGKGCEDDLGKAAAFKTSCLRRILFYTAWVFAAFGPSCRLGPKLRLWCFHFRLKRDRRPPNLPFRCSDMHKCPALLILQVSTLLISPVPKTISFTPANSPHVGLEKLPIKFLRLIKAKIFVEANINVLSFEYQTDHQHMYCISLYPSPVLVEYLVEGSLDPKAGSFHLNLTIFIKFLGFWQQTVG